MGKQDRNHSHFFDSPERFADLFNRCLFGGRHVIRPCELAESDSVFGHGTRQNPSGFIICDKAKKWRGIYFSLLILENQTFIDYFMVMRSVKDEVAGYDRQRREGFERDLGKGRKPDGNEFLSRMFKDQRFCPVITLILYVGTDKAWDAIHRTCF